MVVNSISVILTQILWQEPDKTLIQEVMRLDLPMCKKMRKDLLGGVEFPLFSSDVMYGVLSKRLHHSESGTYLYVGDDEGDIVIKFYETLAKKYDFTMKVLPRKEQVAYTQMYKSGG